MAPSHSRKVDDRAHRLGKEEDAVLYSPRNLDRQTRSPGRVRQPDGQNGDLAGTGRTRGRLRQGGAGRHHSRENHREKAPDPQHLDNSAAATPRIYPATRAGDKPVTFPWKYRLWGHGTVCIVRFVRWRKALFKTGALFAV
jgi:hypothetical protein